MDIYTGTCGGTKLQKAIDYGLGCMVSPSPTRNPCKEARKTFCALDNGAFRNFERGYPFMEREFIDTMRKCYRVGINLDFIVVPDIMEAGKDSLVFSMKYAVRKLSTARNLALVVQDGVSPKDVSEYNLTNFTHIFVGGSVKWKWKHAEQWIHYAHKHNKKCHIGRCGTLKRLVKAWELGADSVDSTSFVRNESWHILDAYNQAIKTKETAA